jgi:hypothetical protein
MKTNLLKKHLSKILVVTSLSSVLIVFNQCVVQQVEEVGTAQVDESAFLPPNSEEDPLADMGAGEGGELNEGDTGGTEVARTTTSIAVKDFEQTYKTFQTLTGIDSRNNSNIRNEFTLINTLLANENDLKKFSAAVNIANIKLAGRFCDEMFRNGDYYNGLVSFSITTRPSSVLVGNQGNKEELVDAIMNKFWGPGVQDASEYAGNKADMLSLLDDLMAEENTGDNSATREIAKGLCTAALVSPRVLML